MEKQKQVPRGPIGPIYGQIEDLRANSPEDPTQCFCPRGCLAQWLVARFHS